MPPKRVSVGWVLAAACCLLLTRAAVQANARALACPRTEQPVASMPRGSNAAGLPPSRRPANSLFAGALAPLLTLLLAPPPPPLPARAECAMGSLSATVSAINAKIKPFELSIATTLREDDGIRVYGMVGLPRFRTLRATLAPKRWPLLRPVSLPMPGLLPTQPRSTPSTTTRPSWARPLARPSCTFSALWFADGRHKPCPSTQIPSLLTQQPPPPSLPPCPSKVGEDCRLE